jgi:hypothetical protein
VRPILSISLVRCSKISGLGSTNVPTSAINITTEIATAAMGRVCRTRDADAPKMGMSTNIPKPTRLDARVLRIDHLDGFGMVFGHQLLDIPKISSAWSLRYLALLEHVITPRIFGSNVQDQQ